MFKVELGYGEAKITALQVSFVECGIVAVGEELTLYPHQERRVMPDSNINDDHKPFGITMKDANGAAALLLVESLIHGLIARSILSVHDAVDIIDIAANIERELDATGLAPPFGDFQSLLVPIASSLRVDLNP